MASKTNCNYCDEQIEGEDIFEAVEINARLFHAECGAARLKGMEWEAQWKAANEQRKQREEAAGKEFWGDLWGK